MNHNELFTKLQDKYHKTKSKKVLEEMYVLLLEFYKNYINDYARKRGLKFSKEKIDDLKMLIMYVERIQLANAIEF